MNTTESVTSIESFLDEFNKLDKLYNEAQTILVKENRTDNEKYLQCRSFNRFYLNFQFISYHFSN